MTDLSDFSRFSHDFNALDGYATTVNSNPVVNCTRIIGSQIDFPPAAPDHAPTLRMQSELFCCSIQF
jgi:hypothetical protein